MDFCIFPKRIGRQGRRCLAFKSQESIRDLKAGADGAATGCACTFCTKKKRFFCKDIEISSREENEFFTFPVTVTDTRDRRFHMVKAVFEIEGTKY